ncbi:hypothetical protein POSPLADRAFT_1135236 [Postia placenta MAD-698-R-SB12]|uniref:YjgF-like protein n=1 Tax=Postia placenta MAD-698-R-SB12 TaxID=670580 RepID=A0A1X6N984_9APHY|nr:hypothetical protein POSPLADRAFT_1135236 [Postia placenta MAD-698-R-SB12]OSX64943.1 hypothetical protein POSPLADRAFT_1135236 [Postia placenta MAD-698-R-SB12]
MVKSCVTSREAVPPLPIFSHATVSGKTVYVSGSIGCDKDFKLVGGLEEQTRAGIENMLKIVRSAGADLQNILKVNIFLTNLKEDFAPMNKIYAEYFSEHPPARTCVGVAVLPMGASFEIECICELP